jgi:competence protein ComFC
MGPPGLMCNSCGTAKRYDGWNPLMLCKRCFEAIPWISDVHCQGCGRPEECPDCLRHEFRYITMNRSAVRYNDEMKELLARYKYRGDERLAVLAGKMLVHAYRLYLPDPAVVKRGFDCITYVPVSPDRYEERGFNQAEQMALVLARQVHLPVVSLLARQRHTDKQSFKSRQERFENLMDAFALIPGRADKLQRRIRHKKPRILLVDDVYTTGSTLNQCALVIKKELHEAEVYGLCLAR